MRGGWRHGAADPSHRWIMVIVVIWTFHNMDLSVGLMESLHLWPATLHIRLACTENEFSPYCIKYNARSNLDDLVGKLQGIIKTPFDLYDKKQNTKYLLSKNDFCPSVYFYCNHKVYSVLEKSGVFQALISVTFSSFNKYGHKTKKLIIAWSLTWP